MPLSFLRDRPRALGIAYILAATLLVALADALTKWLSADYGTPQIAFIRCTLGALYMTAFVIVTRRLADLRTRRLEGHMARALLVALVILGVFYALAKIPMIEVEAIGHAAPFFVALLAPVFLNEKVTGHNWLAIGVGFLGVIIILRPDPGHFHVAHVIMFGCALVYALLILLARGLSRTETTIALTFYIYPPSAVIAAITLWHSQWLPPAGLHWLLFALQSLFATLATIFFIAGLRRVDATLTATLDYATLIWVALLGYAIWGEKPDPITFVGIVLIVIGGVYIVRHSTRRMDESIVQQVEH
ncbi:MAG: DMT family transporter [Gammaproteobacteria bacterium]|nr:DMT family transporter [Gammaproteobacteria bacterium]